jgi:sarcosine oxidase, subunit gamma
MLEAARPSPRRPRLPPSTGGGIVAVLPPADRFALRMQGAREEMIVGFDLGGPINSARGAEDRFAARLGPDEWLLVEREGEGERTLEALEKELAGRHHSLVAVGHRNAAIAVSGPHASTVLSAGVPLDLSDRGFPEGMATRTLLAKAEVILIRPADGDGFRVECWRSFAPYVFAFLMNSSREFG